VRGRLCCPRGCRLGSGKNLTHQAVHFDAIGCAFPVGRGGSRTAAAACRRRDDAATHRGVPAVGGGPTCGGVATDSAAAAATAAAAAAATAAARRRQTLVATAPHGGRLSTPRPSWVSHTAVRFRLSSCRLVQMTAVRSDERPLRTAGSRQRRSRLFVHSKQRPCGLDGGEYVRLPAGLCLETARAV